MIPVIKKYASGGSVIAERDPISQLTSTLNLFSGTQNTQTTSPQTITETTKSNLTSDQVQSLIDSSMTSENMAAHAAGMSTYNNSNLALGKAQIAADIAAKTAGTTTTKTSSGGTTTSGTAGALSGSRIEDTLKGLLTQQALSYGAKKLSPFADKISGALESGVDSLVGAISPAIDSGGYMSTGLMAGVPSAESGSGVVDSIVNSDVAANAGDWLSSAWNNVSDFFGFADGGMVNLSGEGISEDSEDDGFADGGYVDRQPSIIPRVPISSETKANGEAAGPRSSSVEETSGGGGSGSEGNRELNPHVRAFLDSETSVERDIRMTKVSDTIGSIVKMATPGANLIGLASGAAGVNKGDNPFTSGLPYSVGAYINKILTGGSQQVAPESPTDPLSAHLALNDNYGTSGGGNYKGPETTGDRGPGGSSGDTAAAAAGATAAGPGYDTGGKVSGPGTGTSDSIPARLSDGEYVIDKKTVDHFGEEFFNKLQSMANPAAVARQKAMGRI